MLPLAASLPIAMIWVTLAASYTPAIAGSSHSAVFASSRQLAQDEEGQGDDTDVPPPDVDKYIKVYKAMQKNRNLTVEQAAAQQGLSVSTFRSLEDRIERNDALREHVREALKPQAAESPAK